MTFPDLTAGARIGRFRLERALGSGGMGRVWAARVESEPGASFALKILHPEVAARPQARERLAREAKASNLVDHSGVARVREVMEIEDELILVMDLLEGETLRERTRKSGALPVSLAAPLVAQVASALRAAHEAGVVHRDIKPENIFLTRGSESGTQVKVLDFGLAKLLESSGVGGPALTANGAQVGTVDYMAPEQVAGHPVDERADIWSLGVVLYEMLAGFRPIVGETRAELLQRISGAAISPIESIVDDVSGRLGQLLGRMLTRNPARRPAASEVEAVLNQG